jgi:hypothetical protein
VLVRIYAHEIEIRDNTTLTLIRRHNRLGKGRVELPEDERIFNPSRQTHQVLSKAHGIGPCAEALCQRLFERQGREAHRRMWGIVSLGKRYPAWLVEQACATAQSRGIESYKAIKTLVEQRLAQLAERNDPQQLPGTLDTSLTQNHELIRDASEYGEFFQSATQLDSLAR